MQVTGTSAGDCIVTVTLLPTTTSNGTKFKVRKRCGSRSRCGQREYDPLARSVADFRVEFLVWVECWLESKTVGVA